MGSTTNFHTHTKTNGIYYWTNLLYAINRVKLISSRQLASQAAVLRGIHYGNACALFSGSGDGQFQWSSSFSPSLTSYLQNEQVRLRLFPLHTSTKSLTWSQLCRWITALGATRFLDVIWRAAAASAQCVRLIATLTKTWCPFRLENERKVVNMSG